MDETEHAARIDELATLLEQAKLDAFPASAARRLERGICLNCGDSLTGPQTRGLHPKCYRKIKRDIDSGRYSEGLAIAQGAIAPEQKSGRKSESGDVRSRILAELAAKVPGATLTSPGQEAAADAAAQEDEQIVSDPGTPVGGRKKKATKKLPAKRTEKKEDRKSKRRKSG